jgi:hypothetical protein
VKEEIIAEESEVKQELGEIEPAGVVPDPEDEEKN